MTVSRSVVAALLLLATSTAADDLFFTMVAEGSSNNKFLEIYNPTDGDIDLADYGYPSW